VNLEQHTLESGKLLVNFQSLEFLIRCFLCEEYKEPIEIPEPGAKRVRETHLTNFDSLGTLIDKYNALVSINHPDYVIDRSIVDIRDGLAHGRVIAKVPNPPLRIFKFNKPSNGFVNLTFDQMLDDDWFNKNRALIFQQTEKVLNCARLQGHKSISGA
jgi:hypothetical protein